MDSSPPSVVIELDTVGSDDDYMEILFMDDSTGSSEEFSLSHVPLSSSNREENNAEVAVKGIPEYNLDKDANEWFAEVIESKDFLHEQLKLEDKKYDDGIVKDIIHGILKSVAESDCNNHYGPITESKEWFKQLKVSVKKCKGDIVEVIQNKIGVNDYKDNKDEILKSKDCPDEKSKVDCSKYEEDIVKDIVKEILNKVDDSDTDGEIVASKVCPDEKSKLDYSKYEESIVKDTVEEILNKVDNIDCKDKNGEIMGSKNCLDEQSEICDKQFDEIIVKDIAEKIINEVIESDSKNKNTAMVESDDCYSKQWKIDDKKYDESVVKDVTEEIINKVTESYDMDKYYGIVEFEDCYNKQLKIDDRKFDKSIVEDIAEEIINKVIESNSKCKSAEIVESEYCYGNLSKIDDTKYEKSIVYSRVERIQKRVSESNCEDACNCKRAKYNPETTTVERMETENERRPTPTLNSTLECSEKHVWSGYIHFKDCSIPTLGYCIRGDREFAAKIMSTMETMRIILKDDRHITKKKIWERFKDSSRFTTVLGVNDGQEKSEAIEDFNKCFASEEKCFYRIFSPIETPKVLYNVYIFKIDLKTKTFIHQIRPDCKLICTKKSFFLMILGHAWEHEVQRYLYKSN